MLIWRKLLDITSILEDFAARFLTHSLRLEHRKDGRDYAVVTDGTMLLAASWDGDRLQRVVTGFDNPPVKRGPEQLSACNITKADVTRIRAAFPSGRGWMSKLLRVRFGAKQASIRAVSDRETDAQFRKSHVNKAAPTARIGVTVTNQDGIYPPWADVIPALDGGITVALNLSRLKRLVDAMSRCDHGEGTHCFLTVRSPSAPIELTLGRSPDDRRTSLAAEGETPADLKVSGILAPVTVSDDINARMSARRAFPVGVGLTRLD